MMTAMMVMMILMTMAMMMTVSTSMTRNKYSNSYVEKDKKPEEQNVLHDPST